MGLRFADQKNEICFFVTTTFREWHQYGLVAGVYEAMADSLGFYSRKYEARVAGYVFMPSHIHLLLFIDGDKLPRFMRDFKKYVSQKSSPDLGITEKNIWMPRYDRVAIRSDRVFRTKLDYIHSNPRRAGLVDIEEAWRWSSAADYVTDSRGEVLVWKDWT
ncbi:MAG: transposase [bacterium]